MLLLFIVAIAVRSERAQVGAVKRSSCWVTLSQMKAFDDAIG